MKDFLKTVVLLGTCYLLFSGCSKEHEAKMNFRLIVLNKTDNTIELYIKDVEATTQEFLHRGDATPNETQTIPGLVIDKEYTLRLSPDNLGADDYFEERIIINDDPEQSDYFLEITN